MADLPVECGGCGAHFQLDPSGNVADAACSECGGTRFFRHQPSPTQSDGTLRNVVDSISQKDQGGNPLGEGTIVGDDGERPAYKRDNFMHGRVAYPTDIPMEYEYTTVPPGMSLAEYHNTPHDTECPICQRAITEPFWSHMQQVHPDVHSAQPKASRTSNMEPYAPLWDESYLPSKTAGPAALLALVPEALGGAEAAGAAGAAAAAAGEAAGGAEAAGAAAAGGGALGMAKQFAPKLVSPLMNHVLNGGGGNAGGMGPEGPESPVAPQDLGIMSHIDNTDIPFLLTADLETPHSVKSVGEQHDDPEKQDQKEFNDQDESPKNLQNPNIDDSGAQGEDAVRDHAGFGDDSPALERMMMVLPLLLHYYQSEESGQSDPIIRGLHDALEQESPGYLTQGGDDPEGHKVIQLIVQQHGQHHANMGGACATCGGVLAADGSCPQCGTKAQQPGMMQPPAFGQPQGGAGGVSFPPNRTATHVGPTSPEQIAAVQQALMQKGHNDLVPDVPLHPENYAHILAEIQGTPNVAPLVDPSEMSPPPGMMNPPGAMPMTDPSQMGGGGAMPMQPMARTAELYGPQTGWPRELPAPRNQQEFHYLEPGEAATGDDLAPGQCPKCGGHRMTPYNGLCPDCGYAMPKDSPDVALPRADPQGAYTLSPGEMDEGTMSPHWGKTADANNAVPRCPKCHSATTSVHALGDNTTDGTNTYFARCHACNNQWKVATSRVVLTELVNPILDQNAAERHEQRPYGGHDPSLTWMDDQGQPLEEGRTYELRTPGFDVPDEVQIVAKKPDELQLKLVGEISNIHDDGSPDFIVKPEDMRVKQYTFTPSDEGTADAASQMGGMPGLEQIPQSGATTDEATNSYPNPGTVSRLLVSDEVAPDDDLCHKCGGTWVEHVASSPSRTMHECARCGSVWETTDDWEGRESSTDLSWLMNENSYGNDFFAEMERAQAMRGAGNSSRNLATVAAKDTRYQEIQERLSRNKHERDQRLAGRHFTPSEQRELINERGAARNSDLLDLAGTHYELRSDYTGKADGENVPASHVFMGL